MDLVGGGTFGPLRGAARRLTEEAESEAVRTGGGDVPPAVISDANLAETCEEMTRSMLADAGVTATYADELPPQAWWDTVKPRRHKPELQVPWFLPSPEEARMMPVLQALTGAVSECQHCCAEGLRAKLHLKLVGLVAGDPRGRSRREELQALECLAALSSWGGASGQDQQLLLEADALLPYICRRLTATAASSTPSSVEQELLLLSLVHNLSVCELGRREILATQLPLLLTRYCCTSTALASRALDVLRALAGDEAVGAEWSLVRRRPNDGLVTDVTGVTDVTELSGVSYVAAPTTAL